MKKLIPSFVFIALLGAIAAPIYAEVVDKIVVVVNTEVITQREIDKALLPYYEQYRTLYKGQELMAKLDEARQAVMEQLIEDRLLLSEAKRLNIEVKESDVDARLEDTRKRIGSKKNFERALIEQNVSIKDLKARYKEQIMTRKMIDEKVGSTIMITPLEINNYYEAHKENFVQPEQIKLSNILIKPTPQLPPEKAAALAKNISEMLKGGGDFPSLAKEYSSGPGATEGGVMGYVGRGDLLPAIEKIVFEMKPGETSGVIQTGLGYHIFKIEEKMDRRVLALIDVRREVEEALFAEKARAKLRGWIESLKKSAYIAFK